MRIIEYLKHPPARETLAALYERAGMTARLGLRTHNSPAAELCAELDLLDADDATILDAMMAHPVLINRPLVETAQGGAPVPTAGRRARDFVSTARAVTAECFGSLILFRDRGRLGDHGGAAGGRQ